MLQESRGRGNEREEMWRGKSQRQSRVGIESVSGLCGFQSSAF